MPDLRRLQYFLAVAEERNFTRAAARLHVAQPALSRQVRQLEKELGVELLHRTTHEFELTEAGRFLLDRGPQLLATSEELWRSVRSFGSGELGTLIFAYGASASYGTAARLLAALAERLPEIVLTTEVKPTPEILAGLNNGSTDVGLIRCPPDGDQLETRTIRRERQGVLVRDDHPLAARAAVEVADIAGEDILLHPREANPGHYDAVIELCRHRGVEPRVQLRTVSFDLAQTPIAIGRAVAIVGESTETGLSRELRWVPLAPAADFAIGLVVRRYGRSPALDRLLDAAAAAARNFGWLNAESSDTDMS
jgi:DNA-binding transcriptional LysR family regulator